MAEDEDDADADASTVTSTAQASPSKVENPLVEPLAAPKSDYQKQMELYFQEEDKTEEMDEISPALILFYLFEDATCKS